MDISGPGARSEIPRRRCPCTNGNLWFTFFNEPPFEACGPTCPATRIPGPTSPFLGGCFVYGWSTRVGPPGPAAPSHRENLVPQGYLTWQHLAFEYLVRASVVRYLLALEDEDGVQLRYRADTDQGFAGIRILVDAFDEYEADRERYPTLDAFVPRVADAFRAMLADPSAGSKRRPGRAPRGFPRSGTSGGGVEVEP